MSENALVVKTYSGRVYAERPESFMWRGRQHRVREIGWSWLEPGQRHFDVRTDEGQCFRLRYDETRDWWALVGIE